MFQKVLELSRSPLDARPLNLYTEASKKVPKLFGIPERDITYICVNNCISNSCFINQLK
jgi:hypothetical protein